jgi:hypothetical protein
MGQRWGAALFLSIGEGRDYYFFEYRAHIFEV